MSPWINGMEIDKEVAEKSPCEECGSKMRYESRAGPAGTPEAGYHAWCICTNPECDNEFEF